MPVFSLLAIFLLWFLYQSCWQGGLEEGAKATYADMKATVKKVTVVAVAAKTGGISAALATTIGKKSVSSGSEIKDDGLSDTQIQR